jgi:uncharacterized protein (DUF1697 family)
MQYIILLRGINVGGNNRVSMAVLKEALLKARLKDVKTYINSGNLLLSSHLTPGEVNDLVEEVIEKTFGFKVHALTIEENVFREIAKALPDSWVNNSEMKCDVMFLWKSIDNNSILDKLFIKPNIDNVK